LDINTDTTEVALQQGMTWILADIINQQKGKVPLKNHVHISLESQGRRKEIMSKSIDDTKAVRDCPYQFATFPRVFTAVARVQDACRRAWKAA
jgi:hypothetical protein